MNTKQTAKEWKELLCYEPKNLSERLEEAQLEQAFAFCESYKDFLDQAKTEREAVSAMVGIAEHNGFAPFDPTRRYQAGDKVYYNNRGKALILATVGEAPIEQGVRVVAAHIDSPRLDLKPNPLYEQAELGLLKTHYYGGIKKYQWSAIPLALHGVVVKKNGEKVQVNLGEAEDDPIFCVTDLLPHLAADQMKRTLNEGIRGEELNVLIGSLAFRDEEASEKVKLNLLRLLYEKYGMTEQDFLTAELEVVPAFKARDLGLDRSMVGAYGQDDRVCAYTAFMAAIDCAVPKQTTVTILADKEEIGSEGNTGLQAAYFAYFVADLAKPYGVDGRTVLSNSVCLSADVNAAYDPTFADVYEKNNSSRCNYGVVLTKYTGSRGKGGSSDASAEYVAKVCRILDRHDVPWQVGELGKVDQGGGGTVAAYLANLGMDVIDVGVPVLSMHAPMEVTAKLDVYAAYLAFCAFAKDENE